MWYMPYMRVRQAVLVYAYIAIGISLAAIALHFVPNSLHLHGHEQVPRINLLMLLGASEALVGGLATALGLSLASENDGHLEVAWTKPVSREGYALGIFAVDIIAMAVCVPFTALCAAIVVDTYFGYQAVTLGPPDELLRTLATFGLPVCIYAWITALSASLKRNRGGIAGLFWPLMIALGVIASLPVPAIHGIATTLNLLNPLALYTTSGSTSQESLWNLAWGWAVAAVLLVVALLQWRRLEL